MSVVALTTLEGDTRDLLRKYDQVTTKVLTAPPAGLISHTCVETENGIRIASIYETEQQAQTFYASTLFQQAIREAGMPAMQPTFLKVHKHLVFQATGAGTATR